MIFISKNDKDLVELKCQNCNQLFNLSYGRYRRVPKDYNFLCKKCMNIKRSKIFDNYSKEERLKLTQQRSQSAKKVWENLSKKQYDERCQHQKDRWSKLSNEEKEKLLINTRIGNKKYMNRSDIKALLIQRNIDFWNKLSETEKHERIKNLNKYKEQYWESLSNIEKIQVKERIKKLKQEAWNKLPEDIKLSRMMKLWKAKSVIGPTEYIFESIIKEIGLKENINYQWGYNSFPYINPEFYNKFGKINQITLEENYPYHNWDFLLFKNNKHPWVIDIDGSAHDPRYMNFKRFNNKYTERMKIDYNDSKRPYQIPDNFKAFIILAYDDNLNDFTKVIGINNSYIGYFKDFINLIKYKNNK